MKFLVVIFCLFFFFIVFLVKISEKVSLQTFHNPLQRVSILDSSYQCQFAFSSSWSNPTKMFLESFHVGKMVCFLMRDRKETLNDRSLNWPQIFVEAQSKQIFFFRFFFFSKARDGRLTGLWGSWLVVVNITWPTCRACPSRSSLTLPFSLGLVSVLVVCAHNTPRGAGREKQGTRLVRGNTTMVLNYDWQQFVFFQLKHSLWFSHLRFAPVRVKQNHILIGMGSLTF